MGEGTKKKKQIILILICLFCAYNIVWFGWRQLRYKKYIENFDVFRPHYSYVLGPKDGFLYNVKLPDYLTYTGNLCVSTEDGTVGLLIWPKIFAGYRFGVQIEADDNTIYNIMLKADFTAEDAAFADLLDTYKETILELRNRANRKWEI